MKVTITLHQFFLSTFWLSLSLITYNKNDLEM